MHKIKAHIKCKKTTARPHCVRSTARMPCRLSADIRKAQENHTRRTAPQPHITHRTQNTENPCVEVTNFIDFFLAEYFCKTDESLYFKSLFPTIYGHSRTTPTPQLMCRKDRRAQQNGSAGIHQHTILRDNNAHSDIQTEICKTQREPLSIKRIRLQSHTSATTFYLRQSNHGTYRF